ncbi:HipA domain-containing protein [Butyrivibrio sp. LC3010]|uniref:HipA domain-containing protein n=1 Tax=Butyrivibrio sp. LC3010 TaxID=1280680 RepID=UPI00040DCADE|nr:HipA domain-containing protein [Butyrivibrio sp. LC3010]
MRCLCCNKEINVADVESVRIGWHKKCVKKFFGTEHLPELDIDDETFEKMADAAVNKGLTIPGVQKKLSVHLSRDAGVSKLTIIDYPAGYIIKPQSAIYKYLPEAEFMVMKMAEAIGIKTVPCALIKTDGSYTYITKRVDRNKSKMLAMEDFCQLSERMTSDKYRGSYENCGKVIKKYSQNIGIDLAELYYRLLFCFVTGNSDMHLKNFSLIENAPGNRIYGLSPAYDLLPVNLLLPEDLDQMALSLNGKKRNIRKKDWMILADNFGLTERVATNLIGKIKGAKDVIINEIGFSYLPEKMKEDMIKIVEARMAVI